MSFKIFANFSPKIPWKKPSDFFYWVDLQKKTMDFTCRIKNIFKKNVVSMKVLFSLIKIKMVNPQ